MTQALGYNSQIIVDEEPTYGADSDPTTTAKYIPILSETIQATKQHLDETVINGLQIHPRKRHDDGFVTVAGDIVVPVDSLNFGFWLKMLFGAPTATVYKLGSVAQPSFLLQKVFVATATKYWKYNGLKISKMTLTLGGRGELTATISVIGQKETVGDAIYTATPVAMAGFTRYKKSHCTMTVSSGNFAQAVEFSIEIDTGLDEEAGAVINGANYLSALPNVNYAVTGSIKSLADTANPLHALMLSGAETDLGFTFTNGAVSMAWSLAEIELDKASLVIPGPKGLYLENKFHAFYDNNANTTALMVTHDITG